MKRTCLTVALTLIAFTLWAQRSEVKKVPLTDMSAFQEQAGNWFVVGDVTINPYIDIHDHPEPPEEETKGKKKRKKRKKNEAPPPEPPKAVTFEPGTGILLNMNDDVKKTNLRTAWEHGDIILDLDVMMPKGSNSGIYLQGRYEVQLLDSWGVQNPRYGDIGGIYRNWETEPGKTYMGKAPSVNAAKAPGLWQHMKIAFQAPRFDASGKKTANARFVYVELNGVRIHENYEVPMPTGGPIEKNEVAKGPIMIQGDHGPVAIRNIQYQLLQQKEISLTDIGYKLWEGDFGSPADFKDTEPVKSGSLPALTCDIEDAPQKFGLQLMGNIEVEEAGVYDLRFGYMGGASIKIGGKEVAWDYGANESKPFRVQLQEGKNPFEIYYVKNLPWWQQKLGLFNNGSFPTALHAYSSFASGGNQPAPIYVKVGNQPRLLRAFLDFKGDNAQRLTHTIGVGGTSGAHFIYDLKAGTPVCMWRGEFVDATPMWHSRGNGSFRPKGSAQYFFTGPSIARISLTDPFPSEVMSEEDGFHNKGYTLDQKTGYPIFQYQLDTLEIQDFITPDETGNALTRSITVENQGDFGKLFVKIADAENAEQLPDGTFVVDQSFYVRAENGTAVMSRDRNGKKEILAMVTNGKAEYTVMW